MVLGALEFRSIIGGGEEDCVLSTNMLVVTVGEDIGLDGWEEKGNMPIDKRCKMLELVAERGRLMLFLFRGVGNGRVKWEGSRSGREDNSAPSL